jgi:hypothetical protein
MGFFTRAASVADSRAVAVPPAIRRARKLEERGTPPNGVVTGVKFSLNDETTRKEFAITALDTGERFGVRTEPRAAHRLRHGLPVVMTTDGGRPVLDWPAMTAAWGIPDEDLLQHGVRKPPPDGIDDTAVNFDVRRHLKKWSPVSATIVSVTRKIVFGLPTLNWDVVLELADGSHALSKSDELPSYAQWWAAPAAVVPAVVKPDDPSKANIDWPTFALQHVDEVGFDDDPVAGSVAAELEQAVVAVPTASAGAETAAPADPSAPVTFDLTMRSWVDARRGGAMNERDFERALRDWQEAGMCTAEQVDAARAAVDAVGE